MKELTQVCIFPVNWYRFFISVFISFFSLISISTFAEDIELYVKSGASSSDDARPQILLIFDTSGSMESNHVLVKPSFDPSLNYGTAGDGYLYYATGNDNLANVPNPSNLSETRKFAVDINACKTAKDLLASQGVYRGLLREYTFEGESGKWTKLPDTGTVTTTIVDCLDDISEDYDDNLAFNSTPYGRGYPVNGLGDSSNPVYHTANKVDSNANWSGKVVTLYSAKYLRWYHDNSLPSIYKTYMEVAQESVANLINTSPGIDFGLQVFNANSHTGAYSGGRIISGIKKSTVTSRASLTTIVNSLDGTGNTPLCETLYEASRYLGGGNVFFALQEGYSLPTRDTSIEETVSMTAAPKYISPFKACSKEITIIMFTDGQPNIDTSADSLISALPPTSEPASDYYGSYMPKLAGWMLSHDINTNLPGEQHARTYTISFGSAIGSDARNLLQETATKGGGEYHHATDAQSLSNILGTAVGGVSVGRATLTSAAVGANNFQQSETLDSVYYAMFEPDLGPRWQGNLKKYKVESGTQRGSNGVDAVNSDGIFSSGVQSYWSSDIDGDEVGKGGVAEMLRTQTTRKIYSDLGTSGALVDLTLANAITSFGSQTDLATKLDVADDAATIEQYLDWAKGVDVDDADKDTEINDNRPDIFGDPLHSKPLVLNYGNGNIYILVGTNQGMLHLFKDDDTGNSVSETWAFMPKSFFSKIKPLRENNPSVDKIYGVDGEITSHIIDKDGDGNIEAADGDEAWVFFGLRRGGNTYYALNLKNPATPTMMWSKTKDAGNFKALGQTWSKPKIAYSRLNIVSDSANPVLIFGGGYDTGKDNSGVGADDDVGNAIYMLDAKEGTFLWSLAPTGTTTFAGTDSIPSSIAILDSDADGFTDRLYAGDTGGNVWRIDMPGNATSDVSVFKLAELGGGASNGVDRRFFSEPAIARAIITETKDTGTLDIHGEKIVKRKEVPYDAILIGSGDRSNPLGEDTDDMLFMIKDINIKTETFPRVSLPTTPETIKLTELYDYSDNPFKGLAGAAFNNEAILASLESGWYIDLALSGEKSSSKALVYNNVAYFTTFVPPEASAVSGSSCFPENGTSWLYGIDLSLGIKGQDWPSDAEERPTDERAIKINGQFLDSPTLIITENDDGDPTTDDTDTSIIVGLEKIEIPPVLQTNRTYLYIQEQVN